jgi:tetratricopeptide (TPR) repeat protein
LTPVQASTTVPSPPFAVMHEALDQALHLRFTQAAETIVQLQGAAPSPLAARLIQGIIAYLQLRWQSRPSSAPLETSHTLLQGVLDAGQKQLSTMPREPQLLLFLGLAAIFDALLQPQHNAWSSMQLLVQGRGWLQQTLMTDSTMTDAHLGLGLMYFAGAELPALLQPLWKYLQGPGMDSAIHHLQQAAVSGHFTKNLARTFLVQLYVLEKRFAEASALGEELLAEFPENGYYAVVTGRSQCAQGQYTQCAMTMEKLQAALAATKTQLGDKDQRFDLYYYWGVSLQETGQYEPAFDAFRRAINEDPGTVRDESLWAKYHLATLYERRGQTATAQQLYRWLLRERNVAALHQQIQHRLSQRP